MNILNECPECYIQKCTKCGAILQYSQDEILLANKIYSNKTGTFCASQDHIVCAACGKIILAVTNWLYENKEN